MASGEGFVPGLLHKALPLLGATNELMQRKSLTHAQQNGINSVLVKQNGHRLLFISGHYVMGSHFTFEVLPECGGIISHMFVLIK